MSGKPSPIHIKCVEVLKRGSSEHPHGLQQAQEVDHNLQTAAIGTRGSWFYHYHTSREQKCKTRKSDLDYPKWTMNNRQNSLVGLIIG